LKEKSGRRARGTAPKGKGARLRTILDSMVEAVFVVDQSGRVTLTNRALDELLHRDARGSRPKNVIRSKDLRLAIRRARKERAATQVELEGEIGGKVRTFHAQVSPLPGHGGVVTVLHDVTSLKAADRVRRDFVANASHELRTPLTAIRGFAETLWDGAIADPEAGPRFVDGILRHTARLQRLTEDLVLLSRAESPEQDYEPSHTDVAKLAEEGVASLDSSARKKGIRVQLEVPEPVHLSVNERAFEGVLINLVDNAIKYSHPGGEVRVSVVREAGQLVLSVRDSGVGIPPELQQRIFERFFRVDKGRSRDEGGTGLGLSIVRHLTSRMGGTIELESAPGAGSLFRIRLPAEPV
jgi:two-component system, OmpR family, phosphate regulon sensor histidine kinase PhoR